MRKIVLALGLGLAAACAHAQEKPYWGISGAMIQSTLHSSNNGAEDIITGPADLDWRDAGATMASDSADARVPTVALRWGTALHPNFALEGSLFLPTSVESKVRLDDHVFEQTLTWGGTLFLRPQLPLSGSGSTLYLLAGIDTIRAKYKTQYFIYSHEKSQAFFEPAFGLGGVIALGRDWGLDLNLVHLADDMDMVQLGVQFTVH